MNAARRVLLVVGALGVAIGVGTLGRVAYLEWAAFALQSDARTLLAHAGRGTDRVTATPRREEGDILGQISIARIGLTAVIVEGETEQVLGRAVGHLPDTPVPGSRGNAALAGHRDSFFRPLRRIEVGDVVHITTAQSAAVDYRVTWTAVVSPHDLWVLRPTDESTLTLITCFPFTFVGPAQRRFVVRASALPQESVHGAAAAWPSPHHE